MPWKELINISVLMEMNNNKNKFIGFIMNI